MPSAFHRPPVLHGGRSAPPASPLADRRVEARAFSSGTEAQLPMKNPRSHHGRHTALRFSGHLPLPNPACSGLCFAALARR